MLSGRRRILALCNTSIKAYAVMYVKYVCKTLYGESWYHPVSKPAVKVEIPVSCSRSFPLAYCVIVCVYLLVVEFTVAMQKIILEGDRSIKDWTKLQLLVYQKVMFSK